MVINNYPGVGSMTILASVGSGAFTVAVALGFGLALMAGIYAVLTAIFVLVILVSTKKAPGTAARAIPLTLVAIHVAATPFTGASVNPARSLAPAIVGADGPNLWVYLVAPLVGAVVGWALCHLFGEEDPEAAQIGAPGR